MKTKTSFFKKTILVLDIVLCSIFYGSSQTCDNPPSCLYNPTLATGTGGVVNPGSTTINDWYRSHGEPEIVLGGGYGGSNAAKLQAYSGAGIPGGGGVFACYNFKKNRTYKLCFWVKDGGGSSTSGRLYVEAANGLTQTPTPGSHNIPNPASQLIDNSYTYNASWSQVSVTFTPTVDYNQLWFYPNNGPILPDQYHVLISNITLFETPLGFGVSAACEGSLVLPDYTGGCGAITAWYDSKMNFLGNGRVVIDDVVPSMGGEYTMVITNAGCSYSLQVQVYIAPCNCDEVEADFNAQVPPNPVLFTETTTGPGTSVGWYWDFGDGGTSNEQNPSHGYAQVGDYEVCLTVIRKVGDQTCCVKICKNVEVGIPFEDFVSTETGFATDQPGFPKNTVMFKNTSRSRSLVHEYHWDFGDGKVSEQESPAHIYSSPGTYQVCLVHTDYVFDENGAKAEEVTSRNCQVVEVKGNAGIKDMPGEATILPNPATSEATVLVKNMPNARVALYSASGAELATGKQLQPGRFQLKLDTLPPGMYMVKIQSDNGEQVLKLVKE